MDTLRKFKKPLLLSAGAIALWAIQFLLFPAIFPRFFPQSNEAAFLLLVPLLLAAVACTWIFRVRLIQWLPANCIYTLLTALLNGSGHYGIGLRGIRLNARRVDSQLGGAYPSST